jgi:hypothetical protein
MRIPILFRGNGSANKFPRQRIIVESFIFNAVRVILKKSRRYAQFLFGVHCVYTARKQVNNYKKIRYSD